MCVYIYIYIYVCIRVCIYIYIYIHMLWRARLHHRDICEASCIDAGHDVGTV